MAGPGQNIDVDGRAVRVTNLQKPLYPSGFTKGDVLAYYDAVAPVMLPHLADRPATFVRFPNGSEENSFFTKNAPKGTPPWVRTVNLPAPGSTKDRDTIDYVIVAERATLLWAANLAALEIHVPQWRVGPRGAAHEPDLLVVDLDPGPPATIVECCQVALLMRETLGRTAVAKTSGSKGLQVYARWPGGDSRAAMHDYALTLQSEHPDLVVAKMTKAIRGGKVLLDWSQNNPAKTTIAPYSLRGRATPTASTPVTWEEVDACRAAADLVFTADDVRSRVLEHGDLFAPLLR